MKERLDILLVKNGFFESREKAKRAIMAGIVLVNDTKIDKAGTLVDVDKEIRIKGETLKYVGRGGLKLEKAIEVFSLDMKDKVVLDVGASTGGFTDCSLQSGASKVYAVDVGTNQLAWKLRQDERVISLENTHIQDLTSENLNGEKVDYVVIDVSFISLKRVFPHLKDFIKSSGKVMALIKPQFEVGKERIGKGGIVKDIVHHDYAISLVKEYAKENGFYLEGIDLSPITGGKGNVEYISLFGLNEKEFEDSLEELFIRAEKLKRGD